LNPVLNFLCLPIYLFFQHNNIALAKERLIEALRQIE
jgi:hypothetical protein